MGDINFQVGKAVSHSECQCLVYVVFVCFECKLDQQIRFGKSELCCELDEGRYVFVFEEIIDCLLKIFVAQF